MFMIIFFGQWVVALPLALVIFRGMGRQKGMPGCCAVCGYDLRGSSSGLCPECGHEDRKPVAQSAASSHDFRVWMSYGLVFVGIVIALGPQVVAYQALSGGHPLFGLSSQDASILCWFWAGPFLIQMLALRLFLVFAGKDKRKAWPVLAVPAALTGILMSFMGLVSNAC